MRSYSRGQPLRTRQPQLEKLPARSPVDRNGRFQQTCEPDYINTYYPYQFRADIPAPHGLIWNFNLSTDQSPLIAWGKETEWTELDRQSPCYEQEAAEVRSPETIGE